MLVIHSTNSSEYGPGSPGYCYLSYVADDHWVSAADDLGPHPTKGQLRGWLGRNPNAMYAGPIHLSADMRDLPHGLEVGHFFCERSARGLSSAHAMRSEVRWDDVRISSAPGDLEQFIEGLIDGLIAPNGRSGEDVRRVEVQGYTEPAKVGGSGPCWRTLTASSAVIEDDYMTVTRLADLLDASPVFAMLDDTYIHFKIQEDDDLHVEGRWTACYVDADGEECIPDEDDDTVRLVGYLEADTGEMIESFPEGLYINCPKVSAFLREYHEEWKPVVPLIGGAGEDVQESRRVNAVDLAKGKAATQFEDEYASMKKTNFVLTPQLSNTYTRWTGQPIYSTSKYRSDNDHLPLAIAREQLDRLTQADFPHVTDTTATLWVGATATEMSRWWSHAGHEFYLHLGDDKDILRILNRIRGMVQKKLEVSHIPSLNAAKGDTRLTISGIEDAIKFITPPGKHKVHLKAPVDRKYDHLMFRDSLYDITADQFSDYWLNSGAKTANAVLFVPDNLISDDAVPSEIYTYHEYYTAPEYVDDFIQEIWPSILLVTPLLPLEQFAGAVHTVLKTMLTTGWNITKTALHDFVKDKYPFEMLGGVVLDLLKIKPIFEQLWRIVKGLLRHYLARVSITWKHGVSNGYDHSYRVWSNWIKNRRHPLKRDGVVVGYVDMEVRAREGEMYYLDFYRSTASSSLVYNLELPKHRKAVHILDFERGWNMKTGKLEKAYWKKVSLDDWWSVFSFCLGEPMESLNYAVVMTQISRRMRGLKLGTNVLVDPMDLDWKDFVSFAMANLLEKCRMDDVLTSIENNEENRKAYKSNLMAILEMLGKTGATIMTCGLAVPIWALYKWLIDVNPTVQFVRYPEDERRTITRPAYKAKSGLPAIFRKEVHELRHGYRPEGHQTPLSVLQRPFTMVLPKKVQARGGVCELCSLQNKGLFSPTGKPEDGQKLFCEKATEPNVHEIGFTENKVQALLTKILEAKTSHEAMSAHKVVECIGWLKKYIEAKPVGYSHTVSIHKIYGGGGTGKSEIIKSTARYYQEMGLDIGIAVPFAQVLEDYKNASILGYREKVDFPAVTTYYMPQLKKVDVLFIDECSAMDWDIIKASAAFLGAKKIYICGDKRQTSLSPERGEGVSVTHDSVVLPEKAVDAHELHLQFRFGAFRTKWANAKYGYRMRSVKLDKDVPEIYLKEGYDKLRRDGYIPDAEMVFTHASADLFGKSSVAGDRSIENMSVRSKQGKTYENAAIAYMQGDKNVMMADGMLNVANTRSKRRPIYVVTNFEDDFVRLLAQELGIDSAEATEKIWTMPFPEAPKPEEVVTLTTEENRLNELVKAHALVGHVEAEEQCEFEETYAVKAFKPEVDPEPKRMVDFYETIFQNCVGKSLKEQGWDDESLARYYRDLYAERFKPLRLCMPPHKLCGDKPGDYVGMYNTDRGRMYTSLKWAVEYMERTHDVIIVEEDSTVYYTLTRSKKNTRPCLMFRLRSEKLHLQTLNKIQRTVGSAIQEYGLDEFHPDYEVPMAALYSGGKFTTAGVADVKDVPDVLVGSFRYGVANAPTFRRLKKPDVPRDVLNQLESNMQAFSSWVYEPRPTVEHLVSTNQKVRAGTDGYKLASVIDPSGAMVAQTALNVVSAHLGVTRDTNIKLNIGHWEWSRTKAGVLKRRTAKEYRSQMPGMGNHFGDTPEETLLASQRLGSTAPKPRLTKEAQMFAHKIAADYFRKVWSPKFFANPEFYNGMIERAMRDAVARNYHGRAEAEKAKGGLFSLQRFRIVVSNKDQFKPIKNDKLKLDKGGQPISQDPAWVNLNFVTYMRTHYGMQKYAANDDIYFDDFENTISFRLRVTEALRKLPEGARYAIADGVEWDSQQNEVTQEAEKELKRLAGSASETIDTWFATRGDAEFIMFGLFRGRTRGTKTSGKLDTKGGNTDIQGMLSNQIFTGKGDKVEATKGDDHLRAQVGLSIDQNAVKRIKTYMGMEIDASIADGGEFIGTSVSRAGMFPSIVRAALKTLARKSKDYKQFTEQQQALRDFVKEVTMMGVEEVIGYSAFAEQRSMDYVRACWSYLVSMAHINKDQWLGSTKLRKSYRGYLPTCFGPTLH